MRVMALTAVFAIAASMCVVDLVAGETKLLGLGIAIGGMATGTGCNLVLVHKWKLGVLVFVACFEP